MPTWKLNNTLLSDTLVKEEINKEIKDFLEFNENEATTFSNLWDTIKAFLREKHIPLSVSKKPKKQKIKTKNKQTKNPQERIYTHSTPEISRTKESKFTQEE